MFVCLKSLHGISQCSLGVLGAVQVLRVSLQYILTSSFILENLAKCCYLEHYSCRGMCRVVCGCSVDRRYVFRQGEESIRPFARPFLYSIFLRPLFTYRHYYHMVPCYSVRPFVRPFVRKPSLR